MCHKHNIDCTKLFTPTVYRGLMSGTVVKVVTALAHYCGATGDKVIGNRR